MAVPEIKQTCLICSDEVTDAEYRRELTCSYGACPGREQAYHEGCNNKYLRKLKQPTDLLMGYQCPVTLDNGKPCSGRITATHPCQPLNQKKKQKRVEAAAAAAAAPKPKLSAPKAKVAKPAVTAAMAAMRPAGEGALRRVGLSVSNVRSAASALPPVRSAVQPVAPGSGPAARLHGTSASAVSSSSSSSAALMRGRVLRQRFIPGWSVPEKARKPSAVPRVERVQLASRQTAEVEAEAGRSSSSSRTQVANTAAAGMADDAAQQGNWEDDGTRVRQSPPPQHDVVGGGMEDSDTHPFLRYAREVSNIERDAVAAPSGGMAEWHAELLETVRSIGSSPRSPATAAAAGPTALLDPTAPDIDDMEDPVIAIDQLFANEEGVIAVLDADGNYIELESVHGASPELIGFDYGAAAGVVTWYVAIRLSTLRKAMHVAGVVNRGPFGKAAEADSFLEPTASVYDTQQLSLPYSRPDDGFGAATADGGQQAEAVDSSMYEQGADLDHLIALCSLPPDLLGPLPESQSSSFPYAAMGHPPMYQQGGLPDMTGLQGSHSAGYIAEAPAQQAAEADVNGLLELLRV